jgi:hypothetical protein
MRHTDTIGSSRPWSRARGGGRGRADRGTGRGKGGVGTSRGSTDPKSDPRGLKRQESELGNETTKK